MGWYGRQQTANFDNIYASVAILLQLQQKRQGHCRKAFERPQSLYTRIFTACAHSRRPFVHIMTHSSAFPTFRSQATFILKNDANSSPRMCAISCVLIAVTNKVINSGTPCQYKASWVPSTLIFLHSNVLTSTLQKSTLYFICSITKTLTTNILTARYPTIPCNMALASYRNTNQQFCPWFYSILGYILIKRCQIMHKCLNFRKANTATDADESLKHTHSNTHKLLIQTIMYLRFHPPSLLLVFYTFHVLPDTMTSQLKPWSQLMKVVKLHLRTSNGSGANTKLPPAKLYKN